MALVRVFFFIILVFPSWSLFHWYAFPCHGLASRAHIVRPYEVVLPRNSLDPILLHPVEVIAVIIFVFPHLFWFCIFQTVHYQRITLAIEMCTFMVIQILNLNRNKERKHLPYSFSTSSHLSVCGEPRSSPGHYNLQSSEGHTAIKKTGVGHRGWCWGEGGCYFRDFFQTE